MVWVDATGVVLGPARDADDGYYVDANGNFWEVERITGIASPNANYSVVEELFMNTNCTGTEIVAGTGPSIPMEVSGVVREVSPTAPLWTTNPRSQRWSDGSCRQTDTVRCDEYVACYLASDVAGFPVLSVPGPFPAPVHAEWR